MKLYFSLTNTLPIPVSEPEWKFRNPLIFSPAFQKCLYIVCFSDRIPANPVSPSKFDVQNVVYPVALDLILPPPERKQSVPCGVSVVRAFVGQKDKGCPAFPLDEFLYRISSDVHCRKTPPSELQPRFSILFANIATFIRLFQPGQDFLTGNRLRPVSSFQLVYSPSGEFSQLGFRKFPTTFIV